MVQATQNSFVSEKGDVSGWVKGTESSVTQHGGSRDGMLTTCEVSFHLPEVPMRLGEKLCVIL